MKFCRWGPELNTRLDESSLVEFARRVELIGNRVLEGLHRSRRGGEGVEFHSALPFSQGEDVRRIDWKRYASTDRLYVQRFQRYEKAAWTLVMDASESMNYESKKEWTKLWAASLCFLAQVWGDRFQLNDLPSTSIEDVFRALLNDQAAVDPSEFSKLDFLPKSHVVILSDLFFDLDQVRSWKSLDEEMESFHWIQILDPKEQSFDFNGVIQFRDMESRDRLVLDARIVQKAYQEKLRAQRSDFQSFFPKASLQVSIVESSPIEDDLFKFFEVL